MQIPVDRIFFINMDKSRIRLKNLIDHFKKLDIKDKDGREPIRIPGVSGNDITHPVISKKDGGKPGRSLSISEKGVYAAHRDIMKLQIENEWEYVLYLEDDVRFYPNKLAELISHWDKLPEYDFFNLSWHYYNHPMPQKLEPVDFPMKHLVKGDGLWLCHSYILSLNGAKKCEEMTRVQSHSIDWHYAQIQSEIPSIGFKIKEITYQENKGSGMKSTIVHT